MILTDETYTVTTSNGEFSLVREEFADICISICLPDFLKDMGEDEANSAFPSSSRPKVIKNCTARKVSFLLGSTDVALPDEKKEETFSHELFTTQRMAISRLTPGFQEYSSRSKEIQGRTVFCFEYGSNALTDNLYNIFFLTYHSGEMIYGTFTCLYEEAVEMNLVFIACLDTLQFKLT